MKELMNYLRRKMYLPIVVVILLILAFIADSPKNILLGYKEILISPSILITDYLSVGGMGATLFNVATILLFNMVLIRRFDLRISGPVFSGIFIILGFSFFGKNIFNTIPIYLGIYLYGRLRKIPFKTFIITILFSTGISPLVSYCMFGFGFPLYVSIPLGVICGVVAGFIIPAFASHTIIFHHGYNLFNTGFALGIISMFFYAMFKAFGYEVETANIISTQYHYHLLIALLVVSILAIIVAFINDHKVITTYCKLLKRSGRLVSDFIRDFDRETVLFNFGLIGLLCVFCVVTLKIQLNGPMIGTILTVMGFASYGMHILNVSFVYIGAFIAVMMTSNNDFSSIHCAIAFFFASGLAPIAGRYKFYTGILAGFLHIIIAPLIIGFQGGFDLYNNGIVAGFVAAIIVVIAEAFSRGGE